MSLIEFLRSQPVPTIALAESKGSWLEEGFDLIATDETMLEELFFCIARNPKASAICCQVSRMTPGLDVVSGLRVESLAYATLQAGGEFRDWLASSGAKVSKVPDEPVLLEREQELLRVTLNSPESRNALSVAMRDGLTQAFRLAAMDGTIERVQLDARGPSFCAGGDLGEFGTARDMSLAHQVRLLRMPAVALATIADKVRCIVHGACVGAGIEMPAFASEIIARPDSRFRLPEVGMGLVPGAGGCVSIPARTGRQAFNALAVTGREISASEALALGLVDGIEEELS